MSAPSGGRDRIRVAAGVVWRRGAILLTQRPPGGRFGLQWEFPGGKIEPGETPERALEREIHEELGVGSTPRRVLATHRHEYDQGLAVEIVFLECELTSHAFATCGAVHAVRWVRPEDMDSSEILAGDRAFLAELAAGRWRPPDRVTDTIHGRDTVHDEER